MFTDDELLLGLRSGDMSFLADLYSRHCGLMRREAQLQGVRRHDCDDVVQEVLLSLARRVKSWRQDKLSATRYITVVARSVARHWVRAARREEGRLCELTGENEPGLRGGRPDLSSEAAALLARLSAAQREAVRLVYLEGMTHVEAASEMGVSVSVSKTRVHRAIMFLREEGSKA